MFQVLEGELKDVEDLANQSECQLARLCCRGHAESQRDADMHNLTVILRQCNVVRPVARPDLAFQQP